MKILFVAAALAATPLAMAHELDMVSPSADQIQKAKDLPGTTIVRVNKNDPYDVSMAFVKDKIKPGTKYANVKFEKVALNAEKTGIAYNSSNELDKTSSTSSWAVGWRGPLGGAGIAGGGYRPYGGYGGGGYGYRGYGGYGGYYPSQPIYPTGGGCGYCPQSYGNCGCNSGYYPNYVYAGYNYPYQPYYGWSEGGYDYSLCGYGGYGGYY